jgi:magnesium-transporting ATPase (P-type)
MFRNSFTATYLYNYTFILLFNLAFTSLPVIVLGGIYDMLNSFRSRADMTWISFRSKSQLQGHLSIPSTLYSWYSWPRIHSPQILAVHDGRSLPIGSCLLYPLPRLDIWPW